MTNHSSSSKGKELVSGSDSTSTTDQEPPTTNRSHKPSHISDHEYDSPSIEDSSDDETSSRHSRRANNGTTLQAIRSRPTNVLARYTTGTSARTELSTASTTDPNFEIDFTDDDPTDPRNWSKLKRSLIIFIISYSTLTVVS